MPQWFHANLSSLIKTLGDQLVFSTKVVILSVVGSHLTLVTSTQCSMREFGVKILKQTFWPFYYFSTVFINFEYDLKSRYFEDFHCFCHYWKSDIFASSPFILLLGFFPIDSVILAHLLFCPKSRSWDLCLGNRREYEKHSFFSTFDIYERIFSSFKRW